VLLIAADVALAGDPGASYRIGSQPTEFLVNEQEGTEVPLATAWSGPRCTRTRSSCSCPTGPARWPASR